MRKDVANLLQRLGRRDFQYQEFADRFTEVELWPIFETLIRDPRILTMEPQAAAGPTMARPGTAVADVVMPAPRAETEEPAVQTPATAAPAPAPAGGERPSLFARYGGGKREEDVTGDVRTLLHHLAQQIEQGKL